MNELQYRGSDGLQDGDKEPQGAAPGQAAAPEAERQLNLGSATFNIQHVENLVIQHGPPEKDIEGQTVMCGL